MAKQIECGKFLVIETTAEEVIGIGGLGICDRCNKPDYRGFYVAVLNCWFCPECYEDWKSTAIYYECDAAVERRNFDRYSKLFGLDENQ